MPAFAPPPATLEAMLQQARVDQHAGRLAEAERLYREILRARPDHLGITNNLGIVLKDQGKLEEAAAIFRGVLVLSPNDLLAHINLGNVLRRQGRLREGEAPPRRAAL